MSFEPRSCLDLPRFGLDLVWPGGCSTRFRNCGTKRTRTRDMAARLNRNVAFTGIFQDSAKHISISSVPESRSAWFEKPDDAGSGMYLEGQTRAGHGRVNTCIYRWEMNRVANGRVTRTKLRPKRGESARARYLQHLRCW